MKIEDVVLTLNARNLTPELDQSREVFQAFTSDLMSDVLTRDYDKTVLITGLANIQSLRTAEMSDISQLIIGRGKEVSTEMIRLARENDIILIASEYSLFRISGMLYAAGIKPLF